MKKLSLLLMLGMTGFAVAQYTTAGNGTTYTLSSLSAAAPSVLVNNGNSYTMTNDITIAATDILLMEENTTLKVDAAKTLFIFGEYKTTATNLIITASDTTNPFKGIRYEDGSKGEMKNTRIEYGGGIRVLNDNFTMDNCIVYKNYGGISTSGAIGFSKGSPVVTNSQFIENDRPAFGSAANATVSATFSNNYIYKNAQTNTPQINMGPGGSAGIKIINNTIIGDRTKTKVGGISASALAGGTNVFLIQGNTIRDNRYGITSYGGTSSGMIKDNIIENNDTENNPDTGGSGISISSAQNVIIRNNQIRNNLYGITALNNASIDVGTESDYGNNTFKDNANTGVTYALYNNTPNPMNAVGNCWREGELSTDAMVEEVIAHQPDNSSLGLVNFKPYKCSSLATTEHQSTANKIYPNPSNGQFFVDTQEAGNYIITDYSGKLVASGILEKGKNRISQNLPSGTYLLIYNSKTKKTSEKLIIR